MDQQKFPYQIRSGLATWRLQGTLDVSEASSLNETARSLASNPKVKRLKIEVEPGTRMGLAGFQILTSLFREMSAGGKSVEWSSDTDPYGGRAW